MREKEREKKLFNEKFACMTLGPVSTHDLNEQAGQPKVYYIPDRLQSPGDLASWQTKKEIKSTLQLK